MNYEELACGIVENIGGGDNLEFGNHCATRLRFRLKDESKLNEGALKSLDGVMGLRTMGGREIQIIIGPNVSEVFQAFQKITGFGDKNSQDNTADNITGESVLAVVKKAGLKESLKLIGSKVMDYLGGTVAPIIPIYLACGMLMAFLTICTTFLGLDSDSGTVTVLNGAANAGFYFIPIVLGWTAARKLDVDPALGALLGMTLLYSTINGVTGLDFLGLSIYPVSYNGSFLPIILGVPFLALVYKFFKNKIPQAVRYFLLPLVTMLLAIPVTLLILGPMGYVCGTGFATVFQWLGEHFKIGAIALWGFITPFAVITGIDKAIFAINMPYMTSTGFDNFFLPGALAGNSAIGGAALAVWFLSKKLQVRSLGMSSGITAILGITEPALYGVCLEFGTPMLGAMSGAAIGSVFAGVVNLKQYYWAGPGLMTSATYISPDGNMFNFYMCLLTIAISAAGGFIMTTLYSVKNKNQYNK